MSNRKRTAGVAALLLLAAIAASAATAAEPGAAEPASSEPASRLDQVIDAILANEARLGETMQQYQPLFETYIQTVEPDATLGTVPVKDYYFFGRLDLPDPAAEAEGKRMFRRKEKALTLFDEFHSQTFKPESFARMLVVDRGSFDREHYTFEFLRAEFLGEVRTLVFDVVPRETKPLNKLRSGRFVGRIWVEDKDWNIVRYNGVYASAMTGASHFDSWRLNMAPGLWLPAYIYTEEADTSVKQLARKHKGQVRIWGYDVERADAEDEFTKVLIDAPETNDRSTLPGQISPVESARAWESEAEDNVIRRLERSGLLAARGEVDGVLETVVTNLEVTNELDIEPPIRCRVLMTSPLESFTIGHTIVVSRGLLDVLPDEASLAMVLAHEMGHVLSGHKLDTRYAFSDRVLVGDREAMQNFEFRRDPLEEREADDRAVALLQNSPYQAKLGNAGLFLKALGKYAERLPSLIRPHFGNLMTDGGTLFRMPQILDAAPDLDPTSLDQVAALPLGGRVKVDPWTARIELMKNNRVALLSPREKMPFQITPLMPYLSRFGADSTDPARSGETLASDRPAHEEPDNR